MDDPKLHHMLDQLCPLHAIVGSDGIILHAAQTLEKLRPETSIVGSSIFDVFDVKRPTGATRMEHLLERKNQNLRLQFKDAPKTGMKGILIPMHNGDASVLNLSFGISVLDAVRDYDLTNADFAPTDLTIEMLYLVEAKSAAMEASRMLNQRLQAAMISAEEQAYTDTLTGLKNRRAMDHVLGRLLTGRDRFSMMHVDLDYFKAVNDTHGHGAGDYVLQRVARIMVEETRDSDTVARVGGDEFVILFPRLSDRAKLADIARRMIERLEEPIPYQGESCIISASAGIVRADDYDQPSAERMLADADLALYASKHAGRARHSFFTPTLRTKEAPTEASVASAEPNSEQGRLDPR